jgi:hypothetical protein
VWGYADSEKSPDDVKFDRIIEELQEILIHPDFERVLCGFMRNHWGVFDGNSGKEAELKVFHQYRAEIQNYLEKVLILKPRISA